MAGDVQELMEILYICLKKEFLFKNTQEEKQCSRSIVMSEILREVSEAKDSSEVRMRPRALSTVTDVNKLTTSKETKFSFSDIVKFRT